MTVGGSGEYLPSFCSTNVSLVLSMEHFLGWHVCRTKLARKMFSRHEVSHENCPENFPNLLNLYSVGPQNSRKISLPKIKNKNHPRSFQERKESIIYICAKKSRELFSALVIVKDRSTISIQPSPQPPLPHCSRSPPHPPSTEMDANR